MSLLKMLAAFAGGAFLGPQLGPLLTTVVETLESNAQSGGGLEGLLKSFQEKGLGEQVASWISTGENKPVSGEQVQAVFGTQIEQLAQRLGLPLNEISENFAQLLPKVIDMLTPDGEVPDSNTLATRLAELKTEVPPPETPA